MFALQGNALVLLGRTGRGNSVERVLTSVGDSPCVITIGRCDAGSSEDAVFALALCDQVLDILDRLGFRGCFTFISGLRVVMMMD